MGRPRRVASPRLAALLGTDGAAHLTEALGDSGSRELDAQLAELAQLGKLNGLQFQVQLWSLWFKLSEKETVERFEALNTKLDQVKQQLDQLVGAVEANHLDSNMFTAQARGAFDRLSNRVRRLEADERRRRRQVAVRCFGRPRRHTSTPEPAPIVLVRSVAAD